jgi:integrase
MAGLRRARVDLAAGTVQVVEVITEPRGVLHVGPPKTRAGRRTVGLPRFVLDALAELLATPGAPEDHVFTGPQGGVLRVSLFRSRFWRPAVRAAGLDGCASTTFATRRWRCGSRPAPTPRRSPPGPATRR